MEVARNARNWDECWTAGRIRHSVVIPCSELMGEVRVPWNRKRDGGQVCQRLMNA